MPFAEDVRAGLTATPKTLPAKYFYDELGSVLFEAISLLPEYYLTRAEAQIFKLHGQEMIDALRPVRLVELGSGSATKTRILLDAAFRRTAQLEFIAIDISKSALESAQHALEARYPALQVRGYSVDYADGLTTGRAASSPGDAGSLSGFQRWKFRTPTGAAFAASYPGSAAVRRWAIARHRPKERSCDARGGL